MVNSHAENSAFLQEKAREIRDTDQFASEIQTHTETELIKADGLASDLVSYMLAEVDWQQLAAYYRGIADAMHEGVYDTALHDHLRDTHLNASSAYKAGYDRGITLYCEANNLTD